MALPEIPETQSNGAMPMQKPLLLGLTIPFALVSTACEPTRIETLKPPAALTECADEPVAPSLPPVDWTSVETARPIQRERDELVFDYVLGLRTYGGDCKADVVGLKAWAETL
jgi:hypothetical protein